MGSGLCATQKVAVVSSWESAPDTVDNPFATFSRKERVCLRETWLRLVDPKEIVGAIFVDILNDEAPELKKVFGVERVPRASMLKSPKLGGHVARFTELLELLTSLLGFTENLLGAWQLLRKTGRMHTQQAFLDENQQNPDATNPHLNYFELVANAFIRQLIPYLSGEIAETLPPGVQRKKFRNANTYSSQMVVGVWQRLFTIVIEQLTDAFAHERRKKTNANNQKALAPHQHVEEEVRKRKKVHERQIEIENTATNASVENKPLEELFEDPF